MHSFVLYECARCHERFRIDGEAEQCPNCHAEAGLEDTHEGDIPFAMKSFGGVIALSLAISLITSIWGLLDPGPPKDQPHWEPQVHKSF